MNREDNNTGVCREPGQVVSKDYLLHGRLRYDAQGRNVVGRNGPHFNNRPLYCSPSSEAAVLAGDRPFLRLLAGSFVLGHWSAALVRGERAKWIHDSSHVEMRYRCGKIEWICEDENFPGTNLKLTAVPLANSDGFALKMVAEIVDERDRLVWMFGGARPEKNAKWVWDPVMRGNPNICRSGDPRKPILKQGLMPEWSEGNLVTVDGSVFSVAASKEAGRKAVGKVNCGNLRAGTASQEPLEVLKHFEGMRPVVAGEILLPGAGDIFWVVQDGTESRDPLHAFEEAIARLETIEIARSSTPDARLDASLASVCHAIDGNCERETSIFRHGAMAFCIRFIGWRVIGGATAIGWHERVRGNSEHYLAFQKTSDELRVRPEPDPDKLLCHESLNSRFHGRGAIEKEKWWTIFDVQSQFFDQTLREWRWTGDRILEEKLRTALEMHLEWMQECFDPDQDGLYESYINTLPTDSVWYSGGGSVEESSYAYYGHRAAADMARRAGDRAGETRHLAQAEKIRKAMHDVLWIPERGHFGLFVEQGGLRRVHSDAWVCSVFLPIDAGLLDEDYALQSLYYTEWGLERIHLPFGGQLCQPSNWVPWKWSVRDMFGGDIAALALAYFQTGLGDEGYELLRGVMHESAFASVVPGAFSHIGAGTDFADNTHMFARSVVEGLFGFQPDYPNDCVTVRPAFPSIWKKAELTTPDFTLRYEQKDGMDCYRVVFARAASLLMIVPVRTEEIETITVNTVPVPGKIEPGFGFTKLSIQSGRGTSFEINIVLRERTPHSAPLRLGGCVNEQISIPVPLSTGVLRDFHGVLEAPSFGEHGVSARLAAKPGHHILLIETLHGRLTRWQICFIHIMDPAADACNSDRTLRLAEDKAEWMCLSLETHFNGDVRAIFKQRYLSPRPNTCSVRLGEDGYSAWTFPHWKLRPPEIQLNNLPELTDAEGRLKTPQGAYFAQIREERNIVFTSRWDNWPTSVEIPVGKKADAVWLLLCGTTFPMQTRIANAEFRFRYADGIVERLELIPPINFWMMCPWGGEDYSYEHDAFCLPKEPPPMVQLGNNCRAMVLSWKLRPDQKLESVTLETLSQEVVIGLMGLSLMNPRKT